MKVGGYSRGGVNVRSGIHISHGLSVCLSFLGKVITA